MFGRNVVDESMKGRQEGILVSFCRLMGAVIGHLDEFCFKLIDDLCCLIAEQSFLCGGKCRGPLECRLCW